MENQTLQHWRRLEGWSELWVHCGAASPQNFPSCNTGTLGSLNDVSPNDVSPNDVSPSPQPPRQQPPLYVLPLSIKKAVFVSLWPAGFTEDDALEAHPRSARVRISFLSKAE